MVNFNTGLYQSYLLQGYNSNYQNNNYQNAYYPAQNQQQDPFSLFSAIGTLDNAANYSMGLPFEQNNYAAQPAAYAQNQGAGFDPMMMMMQMMMSFMQSFMQIMTGQNQANNGLTANNPLTGNYAGAAAGPNGATAVAGNNNINTNNVNNNPLNPDATLANGVGGKALALAEQQLGANEADGSYRKFGQPGPWCAAFVDWAYKQSAGGDVPWKGENFHYCPNIVNWAKKNGVWSGGNNPQTVGQNAKAGDMILFDWDKDGTADHVGMVRAINPDGSIETIEGNTSDAVRHRRYSAGDARVMGFMQAHLLEQQGKL